MNQCRFELEIPQPVLYFSRRDEDNFFSWLKKIAAIKSVDGSTGFVILDLVSSIMDDASLRELIALMSRYDLDMSCLRSQCNDGNAAWFRDPKKYWYEKIFLETS